MLSILVTGITLIFIFYFIFYFLFAIKLYFSRQNLIKNLNKNHSLNISVIIPTHNVEETIMENIKSILNQKGINIIKIIIVSDHNNNATKQCLKKIKTWDKRIEIIELTNGSPSKVRALSTGINKTMTEFIAIVDADTILAKNAILHTFNYLLENKGNFASCLINPIPMKKIIYKSICYDRLFRQHVLQVVRNYFDCSNLPGCFGVFNRKRFIELLENGFQDDLISTYRLYSHKDVVYLLKEVLAYEYERKTFKTLLFQRARWTIGNIQTLPYLYKTISEVNLKKKLIFISYPLLWYFMHYWIVILIFISFIAPIIGVKYLIIMFSGYSILTFLPNITVKSKINLEPIPFFIHITTFPFCITIALFIALCILIKERSLFFTNENFFRRN